MSKAAKKPDASAEPVAPDVPPVDWQAFAETIYGRAEQKGWTIVQLVDKARRLRKGAGNHVSFNGWKHGQHVPTIEKLEPFAWAVGLCLSVELRDQKERMSEPGATVAAQPAGGEMTKYLAPIERLLLDVPAKHREYAAQIVQRAAESAMRDLRDSFGGPDEE